jgi:mycoredoxin-dependent peroxiredoxin
MVLHVSDTAPDFTLADQHGTPTSLSEQIGPVLVVFFPAAFTPVCHDELRALRDLASRVTVLAVSCDSMFVLRALDETEALGYPLLSDFWPHGVVARAYGAFDEVHGTARRVSALVDSRGVVAEVWQSPPGEARDPGAYSLALDLLASG